MRILAIDPGREKCGFALLECDQSILERRIVPTRDVSEVLNRELAAWKPELVLLGDGTFSKSLRLEILPLLKQIPLLVVDEHDSTYRARKLYFRENPPRGIWRWIPLGLQVPPQPYDDFAAALLAIRYLEDKKQNGTT